MTTERRTRIPVARPVIGQAEENYVLDALRSGWVSSVGPYVTAFERSFAAFCGVNEAVTMANGTVALHLALRALGIGEGDEVLVPDLTFIAVPNAVGYLNAVPVLVDCDRRTWCIDPALVEDAITPRTRAIVAVHSYGGVCDMDRLRTAARKHGLFLVEDAAEAHGATFGGQRVGSIGDAAIFSFYGNKIMTTGEGGAITTNNAELAERIRFLKDHGMSRDRRYFHPEVGYNYRLTNVQAAMGLGQLESIESFLLARAEVDARYRAGLDGLPGIVFQELPPGATGVCWLFSLLVTDDAPVTRDQVMAHLAANDVETRPFFVALHEQPPYRSERAFPAATRLSRQGLNLPTASDLPLEQVDQVCELISDLFRRSA